jgi:hypothetical protein
MQNHFGRQHLNQDDLVKADKVHPDRMYFILFITS